MLKQKLLKKRIYNNMRKKDFQRSNDLRGDFALFIEERHFINDGWEIDNTAKKYIQLNFKNEKDIFFRVIKNGSQTNSHGWLDIESGEIFQWG